LSGAFLTPLFRIKTIDVRTRAQLIQIGQQRKTQAQKENGPAIAHRAVRNSGAAYRDRTGDNWNHNPKYKSNKIIDIMMFLVRY